MPSPKVPCSHARVVAVAQKLRAGGQRTRYRCLDCGKLVKTPKEVA